MSLDRQGLVQATQRFRDAFARKADIPTILTHFLHSQTISVHEHGDHTIAPFLGRSFEGVEGVRKYFETIGSLLTYDDLKFVDFIVDAEERKVAVKGRGQFSWLETGEGWDETFAYMFDFDEEGRLYGIRFGQIRGRPTLLGLGSSKRSKK